MSCLLDTSFLARLANESDQRHPVAVGALTELFRREERLLITPQVLTEFWSVATRPVTSQGGLGLSVSAASAIVDAFQREFDIALDTPDIFPTLRRLLSSVEVIGKQIHDARLVAVCHVHSIGGLVTFNTRHFHRFIAIPPGLQPIDPVSIATR